MKPTDPGDELRIITLGNCKSEAEILRRELVKIKFPGSFDVKHFQGPVAFYRRLNDLDFDLLFMDHEFGDAKGFDAVKKIRDENCYRPIVMLTERGHEPVERAMKKGADDCLSKLSLTSDRLEDCIGELLEKHGSRRAEREQQKQLKRLDFMDPQTGLGNANYLKTAARNLRDRNRSEVVAVMLIRVENLRRVNVEYGKKVIRHSLRAGGLALGRKVMDHEVAGHYKTDVLAVVYAYRSKAACWMKALRLFRSLSSMNLIPSKRNGPALTFEYRASVTIASPEDSFQVEAVFERTLEKLDSLKHKREGTKVGF